MYSQVRVDSVVKDESDGLDEGSRSEKVRGTKSQNGRVRKWMAIVIPHVPLRIGTGL